MKTTYNGNNIFGKLNFGLYGYEDIDPEESMHEIKEAFEAQYKDQITERLGSFGVAFLGLEYYSPQFYNYETDSLDLSLEVIDDTKLRAQLETLKPAILKKMEANKSYDGYTALTADTWDGIIDEKGHPDILSIQAIMDGIDFSDFEITDHLVNDYSETCNNCGGYHDKEEDKAEYCKECMDQQKAYNNK